MYGVGKVTSCTAVYGTPLVRCVKGETRHVYTILHGRAYLPMIPTTSFSDDSLLTLTTVYTACHFIVSVSLTNWPTERHRFIVTLTSMVWYFIKYRCLTSPSNMDVQDKAGAAVRRGRGSETERRWDKGHHFLPAQWKRWLQHLRALKSQPFYGGVNPLTFFPFDHPWIRPLSRRARHPFILDAALRMWRHAAQHW